MYYAVYHSPIGPLWLTSDGTHLTGLRMKETAGQFQHLPVFDATFSWLDAYFRGEKPSVRALPLSPSGTEFQRLIWNILLDIPWGHTRTYGDIAAEAAAVIGREKMSAQAVGGAVGRNPISVIIPCHRCIGAKGKLTGYAWGIEKKAWLLRHEEVHS